MPGFTRARVLILASRTAGSDQLIEAVATRASDGACSFTLMVPAVFRGLRPVGAPITYGHAEAERRLSAALPLLSRAAGADVVGIVGSNEPFTAVKDALKLLGFDEVMVSMLPAHLSGWQRDDLPRKIRALGRGRHRGRRRQRAGARRLAPAAWPLTTWAGAPCSRPNGKTVVSAEPFFDMTSSG